MLFTLLVCLGLLYAYDHMTSRMRFWVVFVLVTALTVACDWGILAPCMVMVLRMVADQRRRIAYSALLPIAANGLPALEQLLAAPSLPKPGVRAVSAGRVHGDYPTAVGLQRRPRAAMKWFFYAYYPAHIAVLGLAKGLLFGDWSIASV